MSSPRRSRARLGGAAALAAILLGSAAVGYLALNSDRAPAESGASTCADPTHTFPLNPSKPQDGLTLDGFYISNDTWNAAEYEMSQTLNVCNYGNWYVDAKIGNESTAVKSYPNVHKDFDTNPRVRSLRTITSTFAERAPDTGIYNFAYDIWLNGVADPNSSEVMIWTNNHGQTPAGSPQGEFTSNGRTYTVWRDDRYTAFVDKSNTTEGTVDLRDLLRHTLSEGWAPATSTIGQIDYGVEIVSTDDEPVTFAVTDFSLTTR